MTNRGRGIRAPRAVLLFVIPGLLPTSGATTQIPQEQTPSALIKFLTYQSSRQPDPWRQATLTCGSLGSEASENRAIAQLIVKSGGSAIPDLETAFDSIEKDGRGSAFSANAGWLLIPYAKLKGREAYPRLERMLHNPSLGFLRDALDVAIALSLSLTSYVDSSRMLAWVICRAQEPRDALDQLVLAWEKNDRKWLELSLGPKARSALKLLLRGNTWSSMRIKFWGGNSGSGVAVGYRFEVSGRWSEPEETLEQEPQRIDGISQRTGFELDTSFRNNSGADCGRNLVSFVRNQSTSAFALRYLVDNSDLGGLLRSIASCAAQNAR